MKASLKFRGLVLIPIMTLFIGVPEYGAYIQVTAISIIITTLSILGLNSGFVRYVHEVEKSNRLYTSLLMLALFSSLIGGLLIIITSNQLATYTLRDSQFTFLFVLGGIFVPITALFRLGRSYFQAKRRIKTFSTLQAIEVYLSVAAIAIAVFIFDAWIVGAFLAHLIARSTVVAGIFALIVLDGGFKTPSTSNLWECIQFSIGTMGNHISRSLLDKIDRILLGFFIGASAVGIYSAAYSMAYVILLYFRPLSISFFPEFSKLWSEGDIERIKSYSVTGFRYFAALSIPSITGFWIVGEDILLLLSTQDVASAGVVPMVLISLGLTAKGVGELYTQLYYAADNSKFPALAQGLSVVLNTLLNIFLIPLFGVNGAALATVFSFSLGALMLVVRYQRYLRLLPDLADLSRIVLSTLAMFLILLFISETLPWIVLVILGSLSYAGIMVITGGISRKEIDQVRTFLDV